jgi:hypothetical protein
MAGDWRERLKALRDRFTGKSRAAAHAEDSQPAAPAAIRRPPPADLPARPAKAETVAINLGIDFGTSFTKVCFRDVGTEESSVVPFETSPAGAFIPTVVAIDTTGRLSLGDQIPHRVSVTRVPYLKMRLAGLHLGDDLGTVSGVELGSAAAARALSSWFLASVLRRSQEWIGRNEGARLKNRTPVWSANIGVPVEYCDSGAIKTFNEVLGVAWLWLTSGSIPPTLFDALAAYERSARVLPEHTTDFHAVPEIAAAVHSFVISRESVPGGMSISISAEAPSTGLRLTSSICPASGASTSIRAGSSRSASPRSLRPSAAAPMPMIEERLLAQRRDSQRKASAAGPAARSSGLARLRSLQAPQFRR